MVFLFTSKIIKTVTYFQLFNLNLRQRIIRFKTVK